MKNEEDKNNILTNFDILTIDLINLTINSLSKINESDLMENRINEDNKDIIYSNNYQKNILNNTFENYISKFSNSKLYQRKFIRSIEYINNIIISNKNFKYKNISIKKEIIINITKFSIIIIKNNINNLNHILNKKFLKILILNTYQKILPIENILLIIKIILNSLINKIIEMNKIIKKPSLFKNYILEFINDLFDSLISFPKKIINDNINIKLINDIISIFENFYDKYSFYFDLNKYDIWFKLLGNKIINLDINCPLIYNKIILFLVKIYKFNFQNLFYYKFFYEKSAISFDYYINSLDFFYLLFKEEQIKRLNNEFKIKNGFYIYNNIPLILNKIKFKLNAFSLIFSFKLNKIDNDNDNDNEDIILFNLENNEQKKFILRFIINKKEHNLKIIDSKNYEWNTKVIIELNKEYLICLSQEKKVFGKKIDFFINNIKNVKENNENIMYNYYSNNLFNFPDFEENMNLELGKKNFEGIIGEFIIINKKIKIEDIKHLYNLKENYSDIICSINYKNYFILKNKKYTNDIIYFNNLNYQCVLKILTYEINPILNNNPIIIKPYGELKYLNNRKDNNYIYNNLNIKLYSVNYSILNFATHHGLEYLIFQLHKIISISKNNELLNFYLYKTLKFILEYVKMSSDNIFLVKEQKKIKVEKKYYNLILSLIIILNTKKRKLELDENIRNIFLDFCKIYRENKSYILQTMNFCILLDNKIFNKNKTSNYNRIFDEMILHINNEEKENSLLYNEILFKFLLFDDILKNKEIKHKKYMKILSHFLIGNKNSKIKDIKAMNMHFIRYFLEIKNKNKIYHYLKFIYLNIDSLKANIKKNNEFLIYISNNYNIINGNINCKYCQNIQILCYLLYEILINENIIKKKIEKNNDNYYYDIKNPNYKFIRKIFIQNFNIENNEKLKFIKSSSYYENEMDLLKDILKEKKMKILLLNKDFIPKFNLIIKYFFYLYNEYLKSKNNELKILLKKGIKLILDFLNEISNLEEFNNFEMFNNINNDKNIIKDKENKDIPQKNNNNQIIEFINDLFTSSGIKLLFILYFNLIKEEEIIDYKNIEKYIYISIDKIYNPFYFYLLLPITELNNKIKLNNIFKSEILRIIVTNLIVKNSVIIKSDNINNILTLNSIIILIRIYHIIHSNYLQLTNDLEKTIIIYLKYILENYFLYSKVIYNINLIDNDIIKNEQNNLNIKKENDKYNKLLLEITLDIIFHMLEKKEDTDLISLLKNYLNLEDKNSLFYKIDEYFLSENNNSKYRNIINLLNSSKISTEYCKGTNIDNVLYCLYFSIYFVYKEKSICSKKENNKKQNELNSLIKKVIELLFKDSINIFKIYSKKLKKIKNKINSNDIIFKIYSILFEHFSTKYNDSNFNILDGNEIYKFFIKFLQNPKILNAIEKNKERKLSIILSSKNNNNINDFSFSFSNFKKRKSTYVDENIFQKQEIKNIITENKDIKKVNLRPRSISETFKSEFNNIKNIANKEINLENQIEDNKKENELIYSEDNNYKTPTFCTKESKKDLSEISELNNTKDISTTNNIENESDLDNSLYDDNNNLNFNSNYNCNNSLNQINIIKEEKNENKKIFYLNEKNSTSSINLHHNTLSPNKIVNNEIENKLKERKTTKFLPVNIENNIINEEKNEEEINEYEYEDNHKYLINKLKEIDIPYFYYKKLINKNESKSIRIIYNPKRNIFTLFGFSFREYIFNNKRFNKLKNTFKIKYRYVELEHSIPEEENYYLKYPTKLKNFICNDYYKPFLKPMLNYFEDEYFKKSHTYVNNEIVQKDISEEDEFRKINYEKLILNIKEDKKKILNSENKLKIKIKCENITNKGSIIGNIYLSHSLMIFKDKLNNDNRLSNDNNDFNSKLFYLFSSDKSDILKDKKKYIIMYYSEIKEIILRKYCFTEIAYEIFMKDGRSYFFNFYTIKNRNDFYDSLEESINLVNLELKKELKEDKTNIYYINDNNYYVNLKPINFPNKDFEKEGFKLKYIKNEISNFNYLLLVNKYSSRSYNECNQYIIFPLLYMDINKKKERDLSKAICLNKDELDLSKYENNYDSMGYHFNIHYSTMAYILFYLMRIIPFTYSQIKLQSGHFDSPTRMFSTLNNLLYVLSESDENRELCPELFYSYESLLNLNYNNFGYSIADKKQINHFNSNQNCGIIEFIIDLRKILEKKELSNWINNIFGFNQYNDHYESLNIFPTFSYEQKNNFNNEKGEIYSEIGEDINNLSDEKKEIINERINDIKNRIQLLSLGITPSQLFKNPHPLKEKNININNKKVKQKNNNSLNKVLIDFINQNNFKDLLFIFDYINNEYLKIIFFFENELNIYNYNYENEKDSKFIKLKFEEELKIIKIKPYKNIFIELYNGIFLICRLINKTLLLFSETKKIYIKWPCIITAIEFYSYDKMNTNSNNIINLNKIIIGDEEGNLSLIKIGTEFNDKKKELKINLLDYIHKRHKTFYSYVNGILYNKRLNIILSSCNNGFISINNGFSFELLNLIEINNNPNILDFKLSEYDLLYIYTYDSKYNLYCYTLNGVKISVLNLKNELNNFFVNNYGINIIYQNGEIYEYNCANLKEIESHLDKEDIKDVNNIGEIFYSFNCSKLSNIFIIFNKGSKIIRINNEM